MRPQVLRQVPLCLHLWVAGCLFSHSAAQSNPEDDPFRQCQEAFEENPSDYDASFCFYEVASTGRWDAGLARLLENARTSHNARLVAGHIQYYRRSGRDLEHAYELYQSALRGFESSQDVEGQLLAYVALLEFVLGKLNAAPYDPELNTELDGIVARAISAASGANTGLAEVRALWLEARYLYHRGRDLHRANRLVDTGLAAIEAKSDEKTMRLKRDCLLTKGLILFSIGRPSEARECFIEVDGMQKSLNQTRVVARFNILLTMLMIHEQAPRASARENILKQAREVLQMAEQVRVYSVWAKTNLLLGSMLGESENREEARGYLRKSLDLSREADEELFFAGLWALAWNLIKHGPPDEANTIISLASQIEGEKGRYASFSGRNRLHATWNRPSMGFDDTVSKSYSILEEIERMRENQEDPNFRQELFSAWTSTFTLLAGYILSDQRASERQRLEEAFRVIERMRARVLLETLGESDLMPTQFATLQEIEAELGKNEVLFSFALGSHRDVHGDFGGGAWLLGSTRQGTRFYALKESDGVFLKDRLPTYKDLIDARQGDEEALSIELYRHLLQAALADLPTEVDRIILVPDAVLYELPFASLRTDDESLPVLFGRYELEIVPSATLWKLWRNKPQGQLAPRESVLAMAAPDLSSFRAAEASTRGWNLPADKLGPLPYAQTEGRDLYRKLGRSGLLLEGGDASESRFKKTSHDEFTIVHFASHTIISGDDSDWSAIILTPGEGEDGLLTLEEIARMDLKDQVVVLSSCQSASGRILKGEGVIGLTRAFFEAGARTVVGNLWLVRDDEAAEFFDVFYRGLSDGLSISAALRAAQLERFEDGAPADAWAGFVVLGDGSYVPFPGGIPFSFRGWWPELLGAGGMLLAVGLILLGIWRLR